MTRRSPDPVPPPPSSPSAIPTPPEDQVDPKLAELVAELRQLRRDLRNCQTAISEGNRRHQAALIAISDVIAGPARLVIDELIAELDA